MPPRAKRPRKQGKAAGTGANPEDPPPELGGDHGKQNNFKIWQQIDNFNANGTSGKKKPYMALPYVEELSESLKNFCIKHGIQVHHKGGNTIKSLLMTPKEKDPITKKSGIIYRFKCNMVECDDEYIGESWKNIWREVQGTPEGPLPNI